MDIDKPIEIHSFEVPPHVNGGESVIVTTKIFTNGDKDKLGNNEIYLNQSISLQSYSNSMELLLVGNPLTPEILRDLANELDRAINKAKRLK